MRRVNVELLPVRVSSELKAQLKDIARLQNRTVVELAARVLEHYVHESNAKSEQLRKIQDLASN